MSSLHFGTILRISRPRVWLYFFGAFVLGVLSGVPSPTELLDWRLAVYGLYFLFPANLLAYGLSDLFDRELDHFQNKKSEDAPVIKPDQTLSLTRWIVTFNIPFVLLLLATNPWAAGAFAIFLFLTIFYSVPPLRVKSRPILDSLFYSLYIFPGIFGHYLAGGTDIRWAAVVASLFWAMAMHAYSRVPSIEADKAAGIHTIATLLGQRITLILCFGMYMAAAILGALFFGNLSRVLGVLYAALIVISIPQQTSHDVQVIYRWFPLVNAMTGVALFAAILIMRLSWWT